MPLSKQHKASTRERIVGHAGRLFRAQGVEAASVGAVMAAAGLTHGGFYAHFASKQDLLREVLTHDHGFIRLLARRVPGALPQWRQQTAQVFADYLNPAHQQEVAAGCSFAALTGDAARADEPVRAGYRSAWQRLVGEVLRGPRQTAQAAFDAAGAAQRQQASALVGMAIGAVSLARVLAPDPAAAALLRGVAAQAEAMLRPSR
jgi:TetR/AcrR family transcriptional repressor of nem operon